MEESESTARGRSTGNGGKQAADQMLMSSKPLHRFVQREPRTLGIVIVIFGAAEVLMGFVLAKETEDVRTSCVLFIPFWQGALFLVCGNLSIYTEIHPSKKMVTVCLAMYVVSLLGLLISVGYRITLLVSYEDYRGGYYSYGWDMYKMLQCIEGILVTSSLCVFVLLIFLSTIARLALKSTRTQLIVHHIPPPIPLSEATPN